MRQLLKLLIAVVIVSSAVTPAAFAHAFLDHAVPGVGMDVSGSPRELRLYFTQGVVVAFSGVKLASASGGAVPASKAVSDPSDPSVLIVRLGRALPPGTYTVSWHVVSVDTHPTSGTFHFTVS
jgi:methionine-rich copper-binding protein CopC